jgi:peroxiredoxin
MKELGQLEARHTDFAKRRARIVAISNDDSAGAKATQDQFPNLVVVSDTEQNIAKAMQVVHTGVGPRGDDTNAPTTFLVDGNGYVRWLARPERFITRLSPDEVLSAVDATWPSH